MTGDAGAAEFPSGAWTGYYQQFGQRHRQDLQLEFRDGAVRGSGGDGIGAFAVRGHYDRAALEVTLVKSYRGSHEVHYRGFREGKGIWGTWAIPPWHRGGFHIWPRGSGATAAAEDEGAVTRKEVVLTPAPRGAPVRGRSL